MKKIAKIDEIPRNGSKLVMINDKPIALFNLEGRIIAWDNRCPHRGASLADSHISCLLYTSPSPRDQRG